MWHNDATIRVAFAFGHSMTTRRPGRDDPKPSHGGPRSRCVRRQKLQRKTIPLQNTIRRSLPMRPRRSDPLQVVSTRKYRVDIYVYLGWRSRLDIHVYRSDPRAHAAVPPNHLSCGGTAWQSETCTAYYGLLPPCIRRRQVALLGAQVETLPELGAQVDSTTTTSHYFPCVCWDPLLCAEIPH
jgi:hypothetical protein